MSLVEYNIERILGNGSIGQVYLARNSRDGKLYAIKKIMLMDVETQTVAEDEAKLLSEVKHTNIITYKESFIDRLGYLNIIMKFAPGGDLASEIRRRRMNNDFISEHEAMTWSVQIFMALKYLHSKGIVHKDIRPQNIFLNKQGIIKAGDIGIAKVMETRLSAYAGTPHYMSPELFAHKPFTHKSDIWALGCCMYEFVTLRRAFDAEDMIELERKILQSKTERMPFLYSKRLRDLIEEMLRKHSKNRPSVKYILRNEYVKLHVQRVLDKLSKNKRNFGKELMPEPKTPTQQPNISDEAVEKNLLYDIPTTPASNDLKMRTTDSMVNCGVLSSSREPQHMDSLSASNYEYGQYHRQTCEISNDDVPFLSPHYQPYNPSKYSDITAKFDLHGLSCNASHLSHVGRDSSYHTDGKVPTPLDSAHVLLDSSTRFYPIPTLGRNETTASESHLLENRLDALASSFPRDFPRLPT